MHLRPLDSRASMNLRPPEPAPEGRDDHGLITRILQGDKAGLTRLSERLRCIARILRVLNLKHARALDDDELADLAQDVLVVIWRKLPDFRGDVALEGWVYGVCVLELRNALRKKRRRLERLTPEGVPAIEPESESEEPRDYGDVHAVLERLDPVSARVIRFKHFEALTFEEIGRRMRLSPNTVKARYYRGLTEMRPLLRRRGEP